MGDSRSSGYYAEQESKTMATECKKSKDGKHEWKVFGLWPSTWRECKHCKTTAYSK
jgi:hypothetical protein